ncbi:NAD(P)-dependent alcohol dehydrogenase [Corynebacterium glutamicum]|uniref:NAD(P)-dependent alcohol dehydrogenase n=1 Tax=Corynebacterium glutamicum TaxID=1718 RepID=UPI00058A5F52|nr:NAD(P)-dependent alcohol dehydrogenase [Corynebacterium glutamicum]AJE68114.1 alcohol dehydrogenase [Corynebacterium glutamicum]OKX90968.1 alcohol dehydrogenase [Corynebacterium glutamicum]TWS37231.1 alcohol dehydrogenase [Corynebacterium glutamicum]
MQTLAAIVRATEQPFEIATIDLDEPRPDEVQVRVIAAGVCPTDAIVRDQIYPTFLPAVFGHEGAGVVVAVGSAITSVKPDDKVVLGFNSCGQCLKCLGGKPAYCEKFYDHNFACTRDDGSTAFSEDGEQVGSHFFGQSTFANYTNVSARSVVKVDDDVPLELLGPLGCGLSTGAGAILNSLGVRAGDTVAVFGTGAVGSAAIMAAAATGATTIIAVDIHNSRLEMTKELGATHTINSKDEDPAEKIKELTGDGVQFALDTTGVVAVTRQAADSLAINGTVGLVGAPAPGTEATFEVGASLVRGWKFQTIIEGDAVPQDFIPRLVHLWRQGKFPIEKLVRTYPLEQINDAFAGSASGEVIKPIITFP